MSAKPVLIHSCQRALRESGRLDCRCQRHITKQRARELVHEGLAAYRTFPSGRVNDLEIALLRHEPPPPARTIDATAIQNAYVEDKVYEQQRIEIYQEVGSMKERASLRRRAGLTQVQLANLVNYPGVTPASISLWEGHALEFRPDQVERIQSVIGGEITRWLRSLD